MTSASASSTSVRTATSVSVSRLSQYTGLLMPLAQVKGSSGLKNTARIFSRSRAILSLISRISISVRFSFFLFRFRSAGSGGPVHSASSVNSRTQRSQASTGSAAAVMGRPTTM